MKPFGIAVLFALCMSTVAQNTSSAETIDWVLRFDGIGAVKVGMTLRQVNAALGEKFSTPKDKDEQTCFYVEPTKHPDTAIMVLNGRVARVDVFAVNGAQPRTATLEGVQIGDSEPMVQKLYGEAVAVSPHHYTDGQYLTVKSGEYGLRFETAQGKVTSFYAGSVKAIGFVEGCS
jgi:hypothetical protein